MAQTAAVTFLVEWIRPIIASENGTSENITRSKSFTASRGTSRLAATSPKDWFIPVNES